MTEDNWTEDNWPEEDPDVDFEGDLVIDFYELHVEWAKQPGLMAKYSKIAAHYKKKADKAAEKKKTVRSNLIKKIKENDPKATAVIIEAEYRTDEEYISAVNDLIEVEYNHSMAQAAVSAFHQKRYALEDIVRLIGMEYFSAPKEDRQAPENMAAAVQEEKNQRSKSVRGRRRRG